MSTGSIIALGLAVGVIAGVFAAFCADEGPLLYGSLAFVTVTGLAIAIPLAVRSQHAWERGCAEQGGHVTSHTSTTTVTTVGADGKPGVGVSTDTTYYCLSADGRVLDVK